VFAPIEHEGETLAVLELTDPTRLLGRHASHTRKKQPAHGFIPAGERLLKVLLAAAAVAFANARHVQQLKELIITDDVTSLYNSRHLYQVLEMEINRSERFGYPFSCLFVDLDRFKRVNDTYGHLVGSRVLRAFGEIVRDELRKIDYIFRYGGDEFVILLPQTPKDSAITVAERLLNRIRHQHFLTAENLDVRITASIGLVSFPEDATTKEGVVRAADEMMYLIKNGSRDGVAAAGRQTQAVGR
jgi:diguanylate cyclase (GGDEF)-like protein